VAVFALIFAVLGLWLPAHDGTTAASKAAQDVTVTLGEFFVKPGSITVDPARPLKLTVTNTGTMQHNLKLEGTKGTGMINPGQSETVDLGVIDHDATAWCTVPGHQAAGMVLQIHVTLASASTAAPSSASAAAPNAAAATDATIDPNATPTADWKPFDPALKPAEGATEHKSTFHATEKVLEVAPGVTQQMWTFNDQVPGPILRGKLGDVFTVTLVNDGSMGHSLDFHASEVAWNDEMRTIQPGESLVYQFKAEHSGIFMYHCGTAPALDHIGNGMYGAVIVDPPDLPTVDHEFVMVQSELYLGAQGQPGDFSKMQNSAFDAVVFNGYYNQYKFSPIRVEPGQTVRVWVLDAGPNENSSFHIVGTVFDTVFKEGAYTLRPSAASGGSQALDLQPAQGGFVEFTLAEPGFYPMVTHKFANVGKGAMGLFQAGDVTMPTGMSH
jgi:nitrite reductase (NO-forming)